MNPNFSDWDEDLPPEPEEAYQDLVRALKRKSGFGLFFVQCTPAEADRLIAKLPQDIPQKKIAALRLVEAIDNLYQQVAEFVKDKQVDILLIKGLEYSLYKYEKRNFGEITEGQFGNLSHVPPFLNNLNQQRERFRENFHICFVFLIRSFSINYLIHRAPDFFDWRSGMFELPTTPKVVEQETSRILNEADYEEYLKLNTEQKIEKILEIQDLLTEPHQAESRKASLLREQGRLLDTAKEYEASLISYEQALKIQPDFHDAWNNKGYALWYLKRYEEAIASYDQALKFKPDFHLAWNNKGIALSNIGHYEESIASYDQALKFQPNFHHACYNKGISLCNLKRYEESVTSFDRVIPVKPDIAEVWLFRGSALVELQRYAEALVCCDRAIQLKPEFIECWSVRGIIFAKLQQHEEAVAACDKAIQQKSDNPSGWYGKACCYALQGNVELAIKNIKWTVELDSKYREIAKKDSIFYVIREDERFQQIIDG